MTKEKEEKKRNPKNRAHIKP